MRHLPYLKTDGSLSHEVQAAPYANLANWAAISDGPIDRDSAPGILLCSEGGDGEGEAWNARTPLDLVLAAGTTPTSFSIPKDTVSTG
ncbi:uncharacterized protein EKO05_0001944 [Ascochyta rabiei]|uniref:uncharacterized protein n=1 Tax=Didymella rabiei TaxID=5454 RepID=UPI00220667A7|nr:uncharacterized protein EKO05_0001944 [Ascochyta rabiei]UPX11336.1 hypothetical protein EKO05_0001944 [Ascochyta rabiei]